MNPERPLAELVDHLWVEQDPVRTFLNAYALCRERWTDTLNRQRDDDGQAEYARKAEQIAACSLGRRTRLGFPGLLPVRVGTECLRVRLRWPAFWRFILPASHI